MSLFSEDAVPEKRSGTFKKKSTLAAADVQKELVRRVPPHNVEAEVAVLGGILTRQGLLNTITDILTPEDFYIPGHQIIYRACLELSAKGAPVDFVTLGDHLDSRGELETIGGALYISQLSQAVVTGANGEYYAGLVRAKAIQRNLITACANIIGNCYDSSRELDSLLDESEQAIFALGTRKGRTDFSKSSDLMAKVFEKLSAMAEEKDIVTGVTTGFDRLDNLTSGLQKSDLIIIAARPSMGKTAFAICLGLNAALKQNVTVGIFSLEMAKEQIMHRMLSVNAKVDLAKIRRPSLLRDDDWQLLYQAADNISSAPIFIDDTPAISTMDLRSRARRLKAEHNLGLIIIDYLQLMRSSRRTDSRELEISDISRSLKALAKELDIPVIALAQLNRKVEERNNKKPILADLRESGAIEQDADVIMFIYRDDVYKFQNPSDRPPEGDAEIIIGKQRNGPVGTCELVYQANYTSFDSKAPDYMPAPSESGGYAS